MVLPVIFLSMAVLLTVFFVCLSAISENSKIHIGVVVPEKGFMERGLLEYVSNMADTKTLCEFRELSETEAKEQLDEGKVAAYVTLPENLLEKIYRNEKTSVHMTTAKTPTIESALMEELVDSAVSFVLTAKAGDYAYQLYAKYGERGKYEDCGDGYEPQLYSFYIAAGNFVSRENDKISFRNERYYAYFSWNYGDTFDSYGGDFDFTAGASDSVIAWLIERKENKPGGYAFF